MIVLCECGARLKIDDGKVPDHGRMKVRCPRCGHMLHLGKEATVHSAPQEASAAPEGTADAPLVLIAHDSDVLRGMVGGVLLDAGFRVDSAADGVEALRKATESKPHCLVLDVGLPGIYGFELCDRLKGNPETEAIKIVLLSSVYDKRRYKRKPTSLYGADDYIEKHHIADILPLKLHRLISGEPGASGVPKDGEHVDCDQPKTASELEASRPGPEVPAGQETAQANAADAACLAPESVSLDASIFQREEYHVLRVHESDPEAAEKARRFARIIVADIALYNQKAVAEGLAGGTLRELLKADIEEGRQLYESRVPEAVKAEKDYYQEALDNFMITVKQKIVH